MIRRVITRLRRLDRRADGVAAVEFAFVAPILLAVVLGTMELGMITFAGSLLEGGLREAARFGITGRDPDGGGSREAHIVEIINTKGAGVLDVSTSDLSTKVYDTFADIGEPEPYTDTNGNGSYDSGEPYTDVNCNTQWDEDMARAGLGAGGEVVLYTVDYEMPLLTGAFLPMIGEDGKFPLTASVAVRNEPFGGATGC